jgi:hypothetical protein
MAYNMHFERSHIPGISLAPKTETPRIIIREEVKNKILNSTKRSDIIREACSNEMLLIKYTITELYEQASFQLLKAIYHKLQREKLPTQWHNRQAVLAL